MREFEALIKKVAENRMVFFVNPDDFESVKAAYAKDGKQPTQEEINGKKYDVFGNTLYIPMKSLNTGQMQIVERKEFNKKVLGISED